WKPRPMREDKEAEGDVVRGRGFAYALYVHSKFPGYGAAWSAWIADVAVNKATGDVSVTRVVAGQDSGLMINPDGVRHQIHGNVIQSTSRALMEEVSFDRTSVTAREWGAYPIIKFPDVPKIDVLMLPRQDQPPLGVGESASVPSAAAIARPDASVYSAATIARGQQLAALGDCAVCHTSANGILNAGGRALETPFGTIYSTNITPDLETGIGAWSYPAFERAMREGIHRDGR